MPSLDMKTVNEMVKAKEFTVKLMGLPSSCKRKHVRAFFDPIKPLSIRIPPRNTGFAYVGFHSERDLKKALNKHKGVLEGRVVHVVRYEKKAEQVHFSRYEKKAKQNMSEKNVEETIPKEPPAELVAETGRLYVRNLCFSVTKQELEELFAPFGRIEEILIPIDFLTKQSMGYALVTYMFSEHAAEALKHLNGIEFKGRMLHVMPGQAKREKREFVSNPKDMTFKQQKAAKQKSLTFSSCNWNTLFLGVNEVADVTSRNYKVSKADIFSAETKESAAVRMSIAETELVVETRNFLLEHGVKLDSFDKKTDLRSKTIIIVKNLMSKASVEQLNEIFSKYGKITRIILPPAGLTALIEYDMPSEAMEAFKRLAYSRFGNKPLYLEWAPADVFSGVTENSKACSAVNSGSVSDGKDLKSEFGLMPYKHRKPTEAVKVKHSNTATLPAVPSRGKDEVKETEKICVRNIPFESTKQEIQNIFEQFGELKYVRLPKQISGGHRGFGFVGYANMQCAKVAFEALSHSTHLLGRRLVLEWAK